MNNQDDGSASEVGEYFSISTAKSIEHSVAIESLRSQLSIVDKAIERVSYGNYGSRETIAPPSVPISVTKGVRTKKKVPKQDPTGDKSFIIDSAGGELATCPYCLIELDGRELKKHVSKLCPNKEVVCPEPGCGCTVRLLHLRYVLL